MPAKYVKTVFRVVVLSTREGYAVENMELETVLQNMNDGDLIGQVEVDSVNGITTKQIKGELLAIGNDGTFFGEP